MMSSASPSPRRMTATAVASFAVAATLALGAAGARGADVTEATPSEVADAQTAAAARGPNPFSDRFPNVVLRSHDGRNVRFYEDLLKDKIVLINFMYATCTER